MEAASVPRLAAVPDNDPVDGEPAARVPRWRTWARGVAAFLILLVAYLVIGSAAPFVALPPLSDAERRALPAAATYEEPDGAGDRAGIVEDNLDALEIRLQLFRTARREIVLTTFDFKADNSGRDVLAELLSAAGRGVRVRLLVDGLTSLVHMAGEAEFYAVAAHPLVDIRLYNTPAVWAPWTLNGRYHDKIIVIDEQLLLLGGRNTYDFFLGDYATASPSHDREALVYNPVGAAGQLPAASAIAEARRYVDGVWSSPDVTGGFEEPDAGVDPGEVEAAREALLQHASDLAGRLPPRTDRGFWEGRTLPVDNVTLVANPTHPWAKEPVIWAVQTRLMHAATRQVVVQTPYYVASDAMNADLAAVARGREVVVLVNSVTTGDNVVASGDYLFHRAGLLATGVEVTEYFGEDSSHGKSLVADDDVSVIGSFNADLRSAHLSTESVLVIAGEEFNAALRARFDVFEEHSVRVRPDGRYETATGEPPVQLSAGRWWFLHVLGLVVQPIRFML